jgi:hypothetical protein
MKLVPRYPIVALNRFIEATRDSGYKNTSAAIAELIDNSFEADASIVEIVISELNVSAKRELNVIVIDDGCGMSPSVLRLALQFGGSTRFNSRSGVGRYGMGLPNSSLSQGRRVDVYSWTQFAVVWWSYLDVDEIATGAIQSVPKPVRVCLKTVDYIVDNKNGSPHGTVVVWSKCDRLNHKKVKTLTAKLHIELGKTFRKQIYSGKTIKINGEAVQPIDPLSLNGGANLQGATQYGPTLKYEIQVPGSASRTHTSSVLVTFSELPIEQWHNLSNDDKRMYGISKGAGVSVLRGNREIDYGWFFMGAKRKENYDDWWRCEVQFDADLDELFGVTHMKQGIRPTEELLSILAPDVERIAHDIHSRVRSRFLRLKANETISPAQSIAARRDYLLAPPSNKLLSVVCASKYNITNGRKVNLKQTLPGLTYRIEHKAIREVSFFIPIVHNGEIVLILNEEHPFYQQVYTSVVEVPPVTKSFRQSLELMLFAAARAEYSEQDGIQRGWAIKYRESWSNILAAFLS